MNIMNNIICDSIITLCFNIFFYYWSSRILVEIYIFYKQNATQINDAINDTINDTIEFYTFICNNNPLLLDCVYNDDENDNDMPLSLIIESDDDDIPSLILESDDDENI